MKWNRQEREGRQLWRTQKMSESITRLKRVIFTSVFTLRWLMQKTTLKLEIYELRWRRFIKKAGICEKCWTHTAHIVLVMLLLYSPIAHAQTIKGKASWYGKNDPTDPWIHKTTASGTAFSEEALTCALRHRKFGNWYRVTNLENGKSVVVKHNDYGPALKWKNPRTGKVVELSDRVIDLSKSAFSRISELRRGVIEVSIEEVIIETKGVCVFSWC